MIHSRIVQKIQDVEIPLIRIEHARGLMGSGARSRIFARAKDRADELCPLINGICVRRFAAGRELGIINDAQVLAQLGGIRDVSRAAQKAQEKIPGIITALEEDISTINFEELEGIDKRVNVWDRMLNVAATISAIFAGISIITSLIASRMQTGSQEICMIAGGIGFGIWMILTFAKEKLEYSFKPDVDKVRELISDLKEGSLELSQKLQELMSTISPFK
ncbi:hypothetical protein KKB44_01105 [Candidatus Micrarchaeota archaeon]|nr:hypothetical protein [Candidatus Micrarchaeota archaeon]